MRPLTLFLPDCGHRLASALLRGVLLALCLLLPGLAGARDDVRLEAYWSQHCPHCLQALPRIRAIAAERPWLQLDAVEITARPEDLERFVRRMQALGSEARSVPTLIYCDRIETGWDDRPDAEAGFIARLEACADATAPPAPAGEHALSLPLLGEVDPARWSLPVLTVVLAALDAFNPCAFFVLLFLLSLLAHQPQRGRMLIVGSVFVACSGLMYLAFMAAWLNLFLMVGALPWITALAGGLALLVGLLNLKDYIAFHRGISLSISEAGQAAIFRRMRRLMQAERLPAMLSATVLLALAANSYELLCTAGFPMAFTRLLTLRAQSTTAHYLYLLLYNLIYVLPLIAIVLAFVRTLGARKLEAHEGRLLKLLSGLMMLGLGLLLLIAPQRLDHPATALGLLLLAGALTALAARRTPQGERKDQRLP